MPFLVEDGSLFFRVRMVGHTAGNSGCGFCAWRSPNALAVGRLRAGRAGKFPSGLVQRALRRSHYLRGRAVVFAILAASLYHPLENFSLGSDSRANLRAATAG